MLYITQILFLFYLFICGEWINKKERKRRTKEIKRRINREYLLMIITTSLKHPLLHSESLSIYIISDSLHLTDKRSQHNNLLKERKQTISPVVFSLKFRSLLLLFIFVFKFRWVPCSFLCYSFRGITHFCRRKGFGFGNKML